MGPPTATLIGSKEAASAHDYGSLLGFDIDSLGDMDGDGLSELLIGAPLHDNSSTYGAGLFTWVQIWRKGRGGGVWRTPRPTVR